MAAGVTNGSDLAMMKNADMICVLGLLMVHRARPIIPPAERSCSPRRKSAVPIAALSSLVQGGSTGLASPGRARAETPAPPLTR